MGSRQNFSDRFLILRSSTAPFRAPRDGVADLVGWDGGQARDVGQRPTVDQVKTRAFARQHVVGALVQYFTNSQSRIRRPVPHAVVDEYAMEALKFGPSSQRPCLG
jgi:nicotinic acid phosphoribosyltransferase